MSNDLVCASVEPSGDNQPSASVRKRLTGGADPDIAAFDRAVPESKVNRRLASSTHVRWSLKSLTTLAYVSDACASPVFSWHMPTRSRASAADPRSFLTACSAIRV